MKAWVLLCVSLVVVSLTSMVSNSYAEELKSDQYIITDSFLDLDPGTSQKKSSDTSSIFLNGSDRTAFMEKGFIVRSVKESISATIDTALIRPANTQIIGERAASAEVSIKYDKGRRAAVSVGILEPMKSLSGSLIDSTKCDRLTNPCTNTQAHKWKSPIALGWGYTLEGESVPDDFLNNQYYRRFSRLDQNEQEEVVVIKDSAKDLSGNKITIKVLKSNNDRVETYQAIIRMTAQLLY